MPRFDVIIIGSGLGGMECANILASNGLRVLVLERNGHPGGCMQSFLRQGLHFDTGFHYIGGLGKGEPLEAPFRMLGLLSLPWQRLDGNGFDRIVAEHRVFQLAQGFDAFTDSLAEHFPHERKSLKAFVETLKASDREQWEALCPLPANHLNSWPTLAVGAWDFLRQHFHDATLINVLSGNAFRMELNRETLPLFVFTHCSSSFIQSSWRLRGSGNLIIKSLIDRLQRLGGKVVCKAEVDELIIRDGKAVAAHCKDGIDYEATLFVSDVHPQQTFTWIKDSHILKSAFLHRINSMQDTYGMLSVQLLLRPFTIPYFNHNYYVYRNGCSPWDLPLSDGVVGGVMLSCRVPEDGSPYTRQIDLLTPMTWAECSCRADSGSEGSGNDYDLLKAHKAAQCMELAEKVIPGLREAVVRRYISTPTTWHNFTLSPFGSAFGLRKDYHNPLVSILSPRTPVANLFLTGQNVMMQGVHGVTITALLTAGEIIGKDTVWKQLGK